MKAYGRSMGEAVYSPTHLDSMLLLVSVCGPKYDWLSHLADWLALHLKSMRLHDLISAMRGKYDIYPFMRAL